MPELWSCAHVVAGWGAMRCLGPASCPVSTSIDALRRAATVVVVTHIAVNRSVALSETGAHVRVEHAPGGARAARSARPSFHVKADLLTDVEDADAD